MEPTPGPAPAPELTPELELAPEPPALIPAWKEALQLMRPGDEWTLYVPPSQGYGEEGAGNGEIPPNSVLIFRIELIDVLPAPGRIGQG